MIKQALDTFNKMYKLEGEKLIVDSYIPADGDYLIISKVNNELKEISRIHIKMDKKTKEIDRTSNYFDFIASADYMSKLIDMNKPIDGKKIIHSNNYLSFMVKKESIYNEKLTNEIIDNYYSILEDQIKKYSKSKNSTELYKLVEERNGKVNKELLEDIKNWIKNNIFSLVSGENNDKNYLKIFFYYDLEDYKKESEKYLIPNIYNSTEFNVRIDNIVHGLPNDNMGLNAKKPYLENKTRKNKVPYLINEDEVLLQKKFFDYLMNKASVGLFNIYINEDKIITPKNGELLDEDFTGIYFRIKKGKEVEIHDMDCITGYNPNIKSLNFENILEANIENLKQTYYEIKTIKGIQNLINEVFFSNYLITNCFTDAKDISINDSNLKRNLLLTRNALVTWFYKGSNINVWNSLNSASLSLLKGSIQNGYYNKAVEQFNLRAALKIYFEGGKNMGDALLEVKNKLREKISFKDRGFIEEDREYFFAVGQIAKFLLSKSKGKKKPQSLINPIINAKNDKMLKEQLKRLYKKYNYDIEQSNKRFNNMYVMVQSYIPNGKANDDLIIAGYLDSLLIYESSKKEGAENE